MLAKGGVVRYAADGMKGRVQSITARQIVVRCADGEAGHLDPFDAVKVLKAWRGDKRAGALVPVAEESTCCGYHAQGGSSCISCGTAIDRAELEREDW